MLLLFCLLLVAIAKTMPNHQGISDELRNIHREIGLLKDENLNQNIEIALLKEMIIASNEEDNKVPGYDMSSNQQLVFEEMMDTQRNFRKRPARLLPARILYKRKNITEAPAKFYGPPTNCSELTKLGYTLNGFYLVKQRSSNSINDDITQLDTVYCAFKQPDGTFKESKLEKRITTQQTKLIVANDTTTIQQLTSGSKNETIRYQAVSNDPEIKFVALSPKNGYNWGDNYGFLPFEIVLNLGNAFDSWGTFKAPRNGDYQFSFQCTLAPKDQRLKVNSLASKLKTSLIFLKNGDVGEYINFTGLAVSKKTIFKLKQGDTMNIFDAEYNENKYLPSHRDLKVESYSYNGSLLKKD